MTLSLASWQLWALLSAARTANFAKVGVEGMDPDIATFVRTPVVLFALGEVLAATGR